MPASPASVVGGLPRTPESPQVAPINQSKAPLQCASHEQQRCNDDGRCGEEFQILAAQDLASHRLGQRRHQMVGKQRAMQALDKANRPWRLAFVSHSLSAVEAIAALPG